MITTPSCFGLYGEVTAYQISNIEGHPLCFQNWWKVVSQKRSLIIVSGYWEFICHLH